MYVTDEKYVEKENRRSHGAPYLQCQCGNLAGRLRNVRAEGGNLRVSDRVLRGANS